MVRRRTRKAIQFHPYENDSRPAQGYLIANLRSRQPQDREFSELAQTSTQAIATGRAL